MAQADVTPLRIVDVATGTVAMRLLPLPDEKVAQQWAEDIARIGYLATAEEHAAGGYEIEWMPVVYGYYEGMVMPPVPQTAGEVVDVAAQLVDRLRRDHTANHNMADRVTDA